MDEIKQPGALIDTRPVEEKERDYRLEEILTSVAPVNWVKKSAAEIRKFPIFDQGQSGSCVAQTGRKMLGVYIQTKTGAFVRLSAGHIYQRRVNRPDGGMGGVDVFVIMQKGTTLEAFALDDKLSDAQMDALVINSFEGHVGEVFKIGNYLTVPTGDIDTIASLIQQTGKAVMVWFYFTGSEWTARPVVKNPGLVLSAPATLRHSVAAVDFTLTDDGKKALIIDDSWGPNAGNGAGQRTIDEDFFKARNWYAAHFMNFAFEDQSTPEPAPGKPKHTFSRDLEFSAEPTSSDPDVVALQDILKYEGLFPTNTASTGYFGAITRTGVEKFQVKYGIVAAGGAGYGRVGPLTRTKLNSLYA